MDCAPPFVPPPPQWQFQFANGTGPSGLLLARSSTTEPFGTVCGFGFDDVAAVAACWSLGYRVSAATYDYGLDASGQQYVSSLSEVDCAGANGPYLQNCSLGTTFIDFCTHGDDIYLDCTAPAPLKVSLLGATRGVVIVQSATASGFVCSDMFDDLAAAAVCRTAGLNGSRAFAIPFYGAPSNYTAFVSDVICAPQDAYLDNCSYTEAGVGSASLCAAWEAVAVDCSGLGRAPAPVIQFTATVAAPGANFGAALADWLYVAPNRIMITGNASNGTAGFTDISFVFTDDATGNDVSRADLDFFLTITPARILLQDLAIFKLSSNSSAAVHQTLNVRLVGGSRASAGLLQVLPTPDSAWGTVCNLGFTPADAVAACASVGFPGAATALLVSNRNYTLYQTGYVYLSNVVCAANQTLQQCDFAYSDPSNSLHPCSHLQDVALDCAPPASVTATTSIAFTSNTSTATMSTSASATATTANVTLTPTITSTTSMTATATSTNSSTVSATSIMGGTNTSTASVSPSATETSSTVNTTVTGSVTSTATATNSSTATATVATNSTVTATTTNSTAIPVTATNTTSVTATATNTTSVTATATNTTSATVTATNTTSVTATATNSSTVTATTATNGSSTTRLSNTTTTTPTNSSTGSATATTGVVVPNSTMTSTSSATNASVTTTTPSVSPSVVPPSGTPVVSAMTFTAEAANATTNMTLLAEMIAAKLGVPITEVSVSPSNGNTIEIVIGRTSSSSPLPNDVIARANALVNNPTEQADLGISGFQNAASEAPTSSPSPPPAEKRTWIIGVAVGGVVLVCIVIGVVYKIRSSSSSSGNRRSDKYDQDYISMMDYRSEA